MPVETCELVSAQRAAEIALRNANQAGEFNTVLGAVVGSAEETEAARQRWLSWIAKKIGEKSAAGEFWASIGVGSLPLFEMRRNEAEVIPFVIDQLESQGYRTRRVTGGGYVLVVEWGPSTSSQSA